MTPTQRTREATVYWPAWLAKTLCAVVALVDNRERAVKAAIRTAEKHMGQKLPGKAAAYVRNVMGG